MFCHHLGKLKKKRTTSSRLNNTSHQQFYNGSGQVFKNYKLTSLYVHLFNKSIRKLLFFVQLHEALTYMHVHMYVRYVTGVDGKISRDPH